MEELPHILYLLHWADELSKTSYYELSAGACHTMGMSLKMQSLLTEAERMYEGALEGSEKALGPEHTSTQETNLGKGVGKVHAVQKVQRGTRLPHDPADSRGETGPENPSKNSQHLATEKHGPACSHRASLATL